MYQNGVAKRFASNSQNSKNCGKYNIDKKNGRVSIPKLYHIQEKLFTELTKEQVQHIVNLNNIMNL
ncbi:hypothetical protein ACIN7338_3912 [Acinetobacter baumannii OIFC338]|nr:hypothetical protein ACIN7338_3912 [Acinetobacter baumannii OIFC338]RQL48641.1 hypothetical protein BJI61_01815 [Acinetobacter baumannii]